MQSEQREDRFLSALPSIASAFQTHPELAQYVEAFERNEVVAELAHEMTTRELREMLPLAPMGHILRMRQLLDSELRPRPVAPASAAWLFPFRMVSGGTLDDNLEEKLPRILGTLHVVCGMAHQFSCWQSACMTVQSGIWSLHAFCSYAISSHSVRRRA